MAEPFHFTIKFMNFIKIIKFHHKARSGDNENEKHDSLQKIAEVPLSRFSRFEDKAAKLFKLFFKVWITLELKV